MSDRSLLIAMGLTGTAFTLFGGTAGAAVWMAAKSAIVGKYVYDRFQGSSGTEANSTRCTLCNGEYSVTVVSTCKHQVCIICAKGKGDSVVFPVDDCAADFFEFHVA